MDTTAPAESQPLWRWVLGFLAVGICWGLTTPFMRHAAVAMAKRPQPARPFMDNPNTTWIQKRFWSIIYAVGDLTRNPSYTIPLLLNVTGSVWFFLLIGQAGKSSPRPWTTYTNIR